MKRPWLNEMDRLLIKHDASVGHVRFFAFRLEQLKKAIRNIFKKR